MKLYKDPLFRRFLSASAFAGAFVWVAVRYFNVDTEVVWVLFVFSIAFVIGMILLGFLGSFFVKLFRRPVKGSMLDKLDSDATSETPQDHSS